MGGGPQHREIGFPISTDNASWRGTNKEADEKSAYKNGQDGGGPTQKMAENKGTLKGKIGGANDSTATK
ncbi:hypothetical protein, partial [Staphylococcus aureus]|uniref:hypothetical protein n=1 Tax=Staphylococcus aureus TaxID=1280 RepID=UPI000A7D54C0